MRAIQIHHDFGIDHLVLAERALERDPGPGQVLLKMRVASPNYRDILIVRGQYDPRQPLPLIPCSDGVGEVIAVGPGVNRVKVGDRIMPCFAQGWIDDPFPFDFRHLTLGGPLDGTLSEFMLLDENGVVEVPGYLSDEEASTLPCAALTAWNAIYEQGCVSRGDTVVVQGTGGVALFALQFAVALDAEVIITSKSEAKLERAKKLGADHALNYVETPEWSRPVKDLTGGLGADHIVELGGSATLRQSIRAVRAGGFVSMIGVLGGPIAEINLPLVAMRNVRLQGVTVGSRNSFERMVAFMEKHKLHPVIDRIFDFEETPQAFRYMEQGMHFGKVCIRIAT